MSSNDRTLVCVIENFIVTLYFTLHYSDTCEEKKTIFYYKYFRVAIKKEE